MNKIAVAANDDCTVAESIENAPSLIVYEVDGKEILSRSLRCYKDDIFEVLEDCDTIVGKPCSEEFKKQLSEKGLTPIFTELESSDEAIGKILDIEDGEEGKGLSDKVMSRH